MADWKTYAKAARNTARRQAPGAKEAARRATARAGDYARAAGKAIDEGRREDDGRRDDEDRRDRESRRDERDRRDDGDRRDDEDREDDQDRAPRAATGRRPGPDTDRLRRDAAAYSTVIGRRVTSAGLIPRAMRALRDALLIGLSLFVIWGVLFIAGIPIPFTTVVIIVLLIVVLSFASGLYAQTRRAREAQEHAEA